MTAPLRLAALALLFAGCGSSHSQDAGPSDAGRDVSSCEHPDEVTYSCEAMPPGSVGCSGEPRPFGSEMIDPDAVYEGGCEITLPYCHTWYPSFPAQCTCMEDPSDPGAYGWVCPL